jgi:hypothetical protein
MFFQMKVAFLRVLQGLVCLIPFDFTEVTFCIFAVTASFQVDAGVGGWKIAGRFGGTHSFL